MVSSRNEKHSFTFVLFRETEKAIGILEYDGQDQKELKWLPKSICDYRNVGTTADNRHELVEVLVPEWLAKEKEFI